MFQRLRPFLVPQGVSFRVFWGFQTVFWAGVFVWRILYNLAHGMGFNVQTFMPRILSLSVFAIMVLCFSHAIVRFMPNRLQFWRVFAITIASLLLAVILAFSDRVIFGWAEGKIILSSILTEGLALSYFFSAWMFVSWTAFFLLIIQFNRVRERDAAIFELREASKEARLQMLVHQLNPHFIFNTLNSISALIDEERSEDAERMLTRLSRFLRHVVDPEPSTLIRLEDELNTAIDYIDIQKVRFGDQLQAKTTCMDQALCDALVPKLILQPLIENAIKFGRAQTGRPTQIDVVAYGQDDYLIIAIDDNGPGFSEEAETNGLGLRLVRERLEAHFDEAAKLTHHSAENGGTRIELRLPLRRSET